MFVCLFVYLQFRSNKIDGDDIDWSIDRSSEYVTIKTSAAALASEVVASAAAAAAAAAAVSKKKKKNYHGWLKERKITFYLEEMKIMTISKLEKIK